MAHCVITYQTRGVSFASVYVVWIEVVCESTFCACAKEHVPSLRLRWVCLSHEPFPRRTLHLLHHDFGGLLEVRIYMRLHECDVLH